MDRSTRNLSIITFVVLAIFLALNHIARHSALIDWWTVLLFLLIAVGIWFYDRVSHRGMDDSEADDTVIEPLVYDHVAPIAIPDSVQVAAPAAPVSAPAPIVTPPPRVDVPAAPPAPELELSAPVSASAPVIEVPPPAQEAKPAQPASKIKAAAAPAQADDLKVVEGIGPKMEKALNAAGIITFAQLAASTEEQLHAAIEAAGMRFAPSVPTWAEQARYAAKGDFAGLEAYQKTLVGGRKAK